MPDLSTLTYELRVTTAPDCRVCKGRGVRRELSGVTFSYPGRTDNMQWRHVPCWCVRVDVAPRPHPTEPPTDG